MPPITDRLLWWKDGSVTDLIKTQCLTTGMCHLGTWFVLDTRTLLSLGRVWYTECG